MISRNDVEHIARLARLELSAAEKTTFAKDLDGILTFVEKLNEVDTSSVEPLTGGTNLENAMREDDRSEQKAVNSEQGRALVEATPRHRNGYVEVNAVFER